MATNSKFKIETKISSVKKINPFAFDKSYYKPYDNLHTLFPYLYFVHDNVILQKDGIFMAVFKYTGNDVETLDDFALESFHSSLNDFIKKYGNNYGFYFDCIRIQNNDYPVFYSYRSQASLLFETERHFYFSNFAHTFSNEYYLCITYKPDKMLEYFVDKLFSDKDDNTDNDNKLYKYLNIFLSELKDIQAFLANYINIEILNFNDICNYLYKAIYLKNINLNLKKNEMFFLDSLFCNDITFNKNYVYTDGIYISYLTFNSLTYSTFNLMFFDLNQLDIEFRLYIRYLPLNKDEAENYITKYKKYFKSKSISMKSTAFEMVSGIETSNINEGELAVANSVTQALVDNSLDDCSFGFLTFTIILYNSDFNKLQEMIKNVTKVASRNGILIRHDKFNTIGSFLGSIPANVYGNIRRFLMTSHNLIDFVPFFSSFQGKLYNNITKQNVPHVICSTQNNSMFFLNLCVGDVGHTSIFGPTGSGKSVLLSTLAISYLKYPNSRVIFFDKDYSCKKSTLACGGTFLDIGNDPNIKIQPLRNLETDKDFIFASEFIELLLQLQNVQIYPDDKKNIIETLNILKSVDKDLRTISAFVHYINNQKIKDSLLIYTKGNTYGNIIDNVENENNNFFYTNFMFISFEMSYLMNLGKQILLPFILYIFNTLDNIFLDKLPTLLILDECWLFFDNEIFRNKIKEWLKVLRKFNVSVIFATQEISDIAKSGIYETLISQIPNKIFLPDQQALNPVLSHLYSSIGLSDIEIRLIAKAIPKKQYFYKSILGSRLFSLELSDFALSLVANSPSERDFIISLQNYENPLQSIINFHSLNEYVDTLIDYFNSNIVFYSN
mgnify:CR=1 FL=1